MSIQTNGERVLLVDFLQGLDLAQELQNVAQRVRERADCDIVMDLAEVTILNSSHLACLLRLRQLVQSRGRRFVLCNVGRLTTGIFSVTGLDAVFEIRADRSDALAMIQADVDPQHPPGHEMPILPADSALPLPAGTGVTPQPRTPAPRPSGLP